MATNQNTISVILTADEKGLITAMRKADDSMRNTADSGEKSFKRISVASNSFTKSFQSDWALATAKIYAAYKIVNEAMTYMEEAAKTRQYKSALKIMADDANVNAEKLIDSMKRATKETVDDSSMMQKAVKLMLSGYNPDQIERFSRVAITASQYMGVSVAESFDMISDALATRMPKAMVKSGAITKDQMTLVSKAIEAGADSTVLMELAIANLEKKELDLRGTQDGLILSMQRFHAQVQESKELIGGGLNRVLQISYGYFQMMASSILAVVAAVAKFKQGIALSAAWEAKMRGNKEDVARFQAEAKEWAKTANLVYGSAEALAKKSADNMAGHVEDIKKATEEEKAAAKAKIDTQIADLNTIINAEKVRKEAEEARKDAEKAALQTIKDREAAYKVMYDELKFAAEGYYQYETKQYKVDRDKNIKDTGDKLLAYEAYVEKKKKLDEAMYDFYFKEVDEANKKAVKAVDDAAKAYNSLMGSIDPVVAQSQKMAEAQKTIDAALKAGIITTIQAAEANLKFAESLANEDAKDRIAALRNMYEDMKADTQEYYEFRLDALDKEKDAYEKLKIDQNMVDRWYYAQKRKLETESTLASLTNIQNAMASTGSAIESISQMYAEGSKQREKYHQMAMAFETAERAAILAKAIVSAVAAVANAAANTRSWIEALAAIASVGAALAAVFASAGLSFGGGGSASRAPVLPESTVLGAAAGVGSESISKSFELLQDTYDMQYDKLADIYHELKSLNQNIMGLVTNIIRKGQGLPEVWTGKTTGFDLVSEQGINKLGSKTLGSIVGSLIGGLAGGWIGTITGGIVGGFRGVNKVLEDVFGGSSKTSQIAGGVGLGAISARELLGGGGVSGYTYADMLKTTKGGWFKSDKKKYWTEYGTMDESTTDLFTQVYKNISETLVDLSIGLGQDTQAALDYAFKSVKINLNDMSSEQINKTLSEHFSAVGDVAIETLFGGLLKGYQKLEEGLLETAVRIMVDKEVVVETLKMTGQAFSGSTAEVIAFSEALINIAGDLNTLRESADKYYDKFFTDAEKQTRLQDQLTDIFTNMNQVFPDTRDEYRKLLEGLDMTTTSGQEAYISLLNAANAADKYYATIEDLANKAEAAERARLEERLRNLQAGLSKAEEDIRRAFDAKKNRLIEQYNAEKARLEERLRNLQAGLSKAEEDIRRAFDAEKNRLIEQHNAERARLEERLRNLQAGLSKAEEDIRRAFDAEKNRLIEQHNVELETMNASLKITKGIVDDLKTSVNMLRNARERMKLEDVAATQTTFLNAQAHLFATLQQARAGDMSGIKDIGKSLEILTSITPETYASSADYKRDFYRIFSTISELETLTGDYLPQEEQALLLQEQQINLLESNHTETLKAMDDQLNTLLGIDTSVLPIAEATVALIAAQEAMKEDIQGQINLLESNHTETLKAMDDQLNTLLGIDTSVLPIAEATVALAAAQEAMKEDIQGQINLLESNHTETLKAMDDQLNALLGINTSVLSVTDAINALIAAQKELLAAGGKVNTFLVKTPPASYMMDQIYESVLGREPDASGNAFYRAQLAEGKDASRIMQEFIDSSEFRTLNQTDLIGGVYQAILGREADPSGAAFYNAQLASGKALYDIAAEMMGSPEYMANIKAVRGFATGGIASGPESGYSATLHGTELIVSPRASYPASVRGGDNVILIEELRALRAELKASNAKIEKNTEKAASTLQIVTRGGRAMQTEAFV